MKNFRFDDNDDDDEFDEKSYEEPNYEEASGFNYDLEDIGFQLELSYLKLNQDLLEITLKICERSFWWRLAGIRKKLSIITRVYRELEVLTSDDIEIELLKEESDEDDDDHDNYE